jgi:hypothetical protein
MRNAKSAEHVESANFGDFKFPKGGMPIPLNDIRLGKRLFAFGLEHQARRPLANELPKQGHHLGANVDVPLPVLCLEEILDLIPPSLLANFNMKFPDVLNPQAARSW